MVIFLAGTSTSDLSVILDIVEMNGALSKYTHYSQRAEATVLTCMDTQRGHCRADDSQVCCGKCPGDKDLLYLLYHQLLTHESEIKSFSRWQILDTVLISSCYHLH